MMAPECKWKQQPFVFLTPDVLTRMFPSSDWTLFNQPNDNTQVLFMTPLADGVTDETSTQIKYPNKIGLIEALIIQNIPQARVVRYGYNRLRYSIRNGMVTGQDAKIVDTNARGMCLFQ